MKPSIQSAQIVVDGIRLEGDLCIPKSAAGIVLFAHGSGSSRRSPRNRFVAGVLQQAGLATLLFDLLTREEEAADALDAHLRFDIPLLATRLVAATRWVGSQAATRQLNLGYFGASTGAAAALVAAAELGAGVQAVVSRGGRPDLAGSLLAAVTAPTLLIVGGNDREVLELNEQARRQLRCQNRLEVVPGASHLFEEAGTLDQAAALAAAWFQSNLGS